MAFYCVFVALLVGLQLDNPAATAEYLWRIAKYRVPVVVGLMTWEDIHMHLQYGALDLVVGIAAKYMWVTGERLTAVVVCFAAWERFTDVGVDLWDWDRDLVFLHFGVLDFFPGIPAELWWVLVFYVRCASSHSMQHAIMP